MISTETAMIATDTGQSSGWQRVGLADGSADGEKHFRNRFL